MDSDKTQQEQNAPVDSEEPKAPEAGAEQESTDARPQTGNETSEKPKEDAPASDASGDIEQ